MTESPYAAHIPFLTSIGGDVTSVLELGSGLYSTPLFLSREAFPKVTRVVSIEHDLTWADKVLARVAGDDRLTLVIIPEPLEDYLATLRLDDFDLIFVDHSASWEPRTLTIQWLAYHVGRSKVAIHDYDYTPYYRAANGFPNQIVGTARRPHTALVWK
jgi:predicted O-methyltransferase YrrM